MANASKKATNVTEGESGQRFIAGLSYIGVLFVVPLLIAKGNKFMQFHVKQGIVLFIADVAASFIVWIPFIGWSIGLAMFIVSFYGFIQALRGEEWELPFLGQYAKKINL
jgi:fumarate reductase subunit D